MPGQHDPGRGDRDPRSNGQPRQTRDAKERLLHIVPPKTDGGDPGSNGGSIPPYEQWTWDQLMKRARNIGVQGRSGMNKNELINALRAR